MSEVIVTVGLRDCCNKQVQPLGLIVQIHDVLIPKSNAEELGMRNRSLIDNLRLSAARQQSRAASAPYA
jgi:hypothetical protein